MGHNYVSSNNIYLFWRFVILSFNFDRIFTILWRRKGVYASFIKQKILRGWVMFSYSIDLFARSFGKRQNFLFEVNVTITWDKIFWFCIFCPQNISVGLCMLQPGNAEWRQITRFNSQTFVLCFLLCETNKNLIYYISCSKWLACIALVFFQRPFSSEISLKQWRSQFS